MSHSTDPALMTLAELAAAIAGRQLSSREATQACLSRIAEWQPVLNAFIAIEPEEALQAADAADARIAEGRATGPFDGVPFAHKDMFYARGKISTCGSRIRRDWIADTDSTALKRLTDQGSVRLGTLHMAEFAYGPTGHNAHFGAAGNPWNPLHVTGGSSSGSGAAVAARLTPAALGSDTGGSIRMPANFCGVTGLKTSVGRVSRFGAMPLSHSLDTIGPLAQTAEDCALVLQAIAGPDSSDPTALPVPVPDYAAACRLGVRGMRLGVPDAFYLDGLEPATARAFEAALDAFRGEGVEIVSVTLPDQMRLSAAGQILLACEAAAFHRRWLAERPEDYGAQVRARLENGLAIPAVTYLEALRWRAIALTEHLQAVEGVDAFLAPVSASASPSIAQSDVGGGPSAEAVIQRITRLMRPVNYLGLPALVVPAGSSDTGLPIGLQIVGRPFEEDRILRLGAGFQRATDFHRAVPQLPGDPQ
ncbi:amidase [Aureimonas sp. OT7]|uniref:amidase n=1 Tax=Aureimonas TaxID=414371 RepID=UPI00177E1E9D|nr:MULTISPECIES: amidase [Aureimonas]QOG06697.1 amidase [Aureimonas sp. OT7]